jgi:class 3 adenylate cyclase
MTATACFVTTLADNRVGFSEPTRGDSEGTVQRLEAYRRQLVYPRIEEHHGRIIRPGDNMLVEFASATEAVRCAVEVQRGVIDRNVGASLDRRITLGVGVDIGETAAIGDDLVSRVVAALPTDELASLVKPGSHRDGGDVAVRLAALAGPAGICISGKVRDAIGEQLPYTFTDIGKQNIDLRASQMHCYVMSADSPAAKPYVAGRKQGGVIRRSARLRSAAIAASLFANVGLGTAAIWMWLNAGSSTAPTRPPVPAGSHMAQASGTAELSALQSAALSSIEADSLTGALPPQPPSASNAAADKGALAPPAEPASPKTGSAVVLGEQAPSVPRTVPASVPAVIRGNQASSALQTTPESGMAVVRGNQAPSSLQVTPDSGAVVIRGNSGPSAPRGTSGSSKNAVSGS